MRRLFPLLLALLPLPSPVALGADRVIQDVRVLNDRCLCVVLDRTSQLLTLARQKYGETLDQAKRDWKDSPSRQWQWEFAKKYRLLALLAQERPGWIEAIESRDYWKINDAPPAEVSFWPSSVGGMPFESADWKPNQEEAPIPRIADYVYLYLNQPLRQGQEYTVRTSDNLQQSLKFDENETICWSIKVNQLGYLPDAPRKFAYIGMWCGGSGPLPFPELEGKKFAVYPFEPGRDYQSGHTLTQTAALAGTVQPRRKEAESRTGDGQPISGEDVFQMDLSNLTHPGTYVVVIPGLGRSWPFEVSSSIYGDAFYTMMKGLYVQRCGVEISANYWPWSRGACHTETFAGGFPPETDRWYETAGYGKTSEGNAAEFGFRDSSGVPVSINHFSVVRSTATEKMIPGLKGGWHDAADYDRRVHHYDVVWDLCGIYEMFPQKFTDRQLNIPESGNGIPDILDEAAIQVDLFIRTQTNDGAVSSWIEQTSHPSHAYSAEKDPNPFYLSLPDRISSLKFAAAAAQLSRLIQPFDRNRASRYLNAARDAYAWGMKETNALRDIRFEVSRGSRDQNLIGKTVHFDEKPELPGATGGKENLTKMLAAAQLYSTTRDRNYLSAWQAGGGAEAAAKGLPDGIPPLAFVTLLREDQLLAGSERSRILKLLSEECDRFLTGQDQLSYRMFWRAPSQGFFNAMAWGNSHSARRARLPVLLWWETKEEKYREAALLACDWELGCNELGRSFITGTGSVFPVVLQHIQSERDSYLEPAPGIAPFGLTFGITPSAYQSQFGLIDKGHDSVKEYFGPVALCLLPKQFGRTEIQARLAQGGEADPVGLMRTAVQSRYPIMRRLFIHPSLQPMQNEFTIQESISPIAAVFAALTPDGWTPGEKLLRRAPRNTPSELPLYPQP